MTKELFIELAKKSIIEYPIYKDDGSAGAIFDKDGIFIQITNDNVKTWPIKYVYNSLNPKSYKFSMKYLDSGFYLQKLKTNDLNYMVMGSYKGDLEISEEDLETILSLLNVEYQRRIEIYERNETLKKIQGVEEWKKELNIL